MRRRELTATEERVARAVAAGLSTREAAVELSLTTTAIEWHLSRVFRKLGANSRAELPRLLAR